MCMTKILIVKSISKNTAIYLINAALIGLMGFVLIPFLTNNLPPDQYGKIEIYSVFVALLSGLLLVGGPTIVSGEYFKSRKKSLSLIGNHLMIIIVLVILGCIINSFLPYTYFYSLPKNVIYLLIITAGFLSINTMNSTIYVLRARPISHGIFNIAFHLLALALSIFLISYYTHNWCGRIYGIFIANVIFGLISIQVLVKMGVQIGISKKSFGFIIRYGVPFLFIHLNGWINEVIDKLMISEIIGIGDTGIYAVGYKFGMITMLVGVAIGRSVTPLIYENLSLNTKKGDKNLVQIILFAAGILFVLSIFVITIGPLLIKRLTHVSYHSSVVIVPIITITYFVDGLWKLFVGFLVFYKRNNLYLLIITATAACNILANYFLLSKLGIIGAAWASLISFSVGAIFTIVASTKLHPLPWVSTLLREKHRE